LAHLRANRMHTGMRGCLGNHAAPPKGVAMPFCVAGDVASFEPGV